MLAEAMTALAAGGGTAIVQAAGTDVWTFCRSRAARLVGLGDREREADALDRLDRTAAALAAAGDEAERVRAAHAVLWQGEITSLLEVLSAAQREQTVAELRALIREFRPSEASAGPVLSGNTFHGPTAVQSGDHNHQENHFGSAG
ncbi:hypothetical protein [Streptomyces sp. NRRL S-813]|uniref:hypothetical protein n=1 Tax=Streptomyces sp. NRRL S-813 TaxID=1463919 RepID=UPI00068D78E7|nr:hypothetical protein [Streptomyces sp. NRRL S-813]